jgi:hypothetical protein
MEKDLNLEVEDILEPTAPLGDDQVAYSIAISLKRIADDMKEIKNGMSFICERWSERR